MRQVSLVSAFISTCHRRQTRADRSECPRPESNQRTRATAQINWWWIDFHQSADAPPSYAGRCQLDGDGALFYFSTDNVQAAHDEVTKAGLHPSEIQQLREDIECVITDPDGYHIAIFKRR